MKIVILADAWQPITGGGQKLFLELVTRLAKDHGCQITVITRALKHQGKIYKKTEKLLNNQLAIIRLGPPAKWPNFLARIWFTFQSAFHALKLKPDLYLASTFLPAFSLKIIKLFKKTPQALVVIGFGAQNKLYRLLEKLITQKLKFDLTITDDTVYFKKVKNTKNIKLIPNGVSLPKQKAVKKWPDFTFLFVGRNEPRKGVNVLQQAFKSLKKSHPQVKLRLIGPGFNLVSQQKLHQEFFKAHCFVLPSLREGHPLVLFEAWAHQLPVIATKVGSLSSFVTEKNGYLVPANDPQALKQAMQKAINNKNLNSLGKNGYQLIKQKYTWQKTTDKYYQALFNLYQPTINLQGETL
ncbi:glycosyltransferase family 4 protein [Patescibacteria group bacterium]